MVIVRHVREAEKPSNTARLASLMLENCEIVPYGAEGQPFDPAGRALEGAYLLYPGSAAPPPPPAPPGTPRTLVVPDGNWSQARRMARRLADRVPMKRLSLDGVPADRVRLRHEARPDTCSTIEAIADALALLEGEAGAHIAAVLHDAYTQMTHNSLKVRGRSTYDASPRD